MKNYLEFEKEIKSLEEDLDSLKSPFGSGGLSQVDTEKIKNLQNEINEKRIKYLVGEMENQWLAIEKLKMVTGADKYITEKPNL